MIWTSLSGDILAQTLAVPGLPLPRGRDIAHITISPHRHIDDTTPSRPPFYRRAGRGFVSVATASV